MESMKNLFSIGNSVSIFFAALLFISIICIFLFDNDSIAPYQSKGDIPLIELNDFVAYEISKDEVKAKLSAKNAKRFAKYEELNEVVLDKTSQNINDKITAKKAIKRENIIYFDDGVQNIRDNYEIYSQKATYDIDSKLISGRDKFYIQSKFERIDGENIEYDAKSGVLKAKNVKAILKPKQ